MGVEIKVKPKVSGEALNALFDAAWQHHKPEENVLERLEQHSLTYLCAFDESDLVGFVNLAWDGGAHGFILDTSVHPDYQRQGIGVKLVREAVELARERGLEWLHVDYEDHLEHFYKACGFSETKAGLINLRSRQ